MSSRLKTCVLVSGNGSNLQALIDACACGLLDININHVISNVPRVKALARAEQAGIASSVLEHGSFSGREEFDRALALLMSVNQPDLVILAGFMRIIGSPVLEPFQGKMINLHPSLLPKYRGTNTYLKAIEAGDREHGASIHFVTEELDGGPVISQVVVPIIAGDGPTDLAARLAPMEHRLIVATVAYMTSHRVKYLNGAVMIDGKQVNTPLKLGTDGTLTEDHS